MAQPLPISSVRNRLLAALPPNSLARLLPKLRPVALPLRKGLTAPHALIDAAYFIESGWASMVAHLDNGTQAEVGLIGYEGMVGLPLVVGVDTAFAEVYMQAEGSALQMERATFQRELDENADLRKLLLRYSDATLAQVIQLAGCNGRHNVEQRLARWLLTAHDRARGDELPLTHEFLALMLCVHRPSVTIVASTLQKAGMIRYQKGIITILNRQALEGTACDCYRIIQERFTYLLT